MHISDWSSDVCSSDLDSRLLDIRKHIQRFGNLAKLAPSRQEVGAPTHLAVAHAGQIKRHHVIIFCQKRCNEGKAARMCQKAMGHQYLGLRSEEHTSELQSLMRISYAVFCLKKKTKKTTR